VDQVPYHNQLHAHHVVMSMNKLLELFLCFTPSQESPTAAAGASTPLSSGSSHRPSPSSPHHRSRRNTAPSNESFRGPPPSFGLRHDPLLLLALVFAAMIHDVEHQGIPNRQLALEDDRLAILYNDQSIAENWSLYVAFSELLQDEFAELRAVM
jgi:3'5'-cyclic nucleotide phosphodiesterase